MEIRTSVRFNEVNFLIGIIDLSLDKEYELVRNLFDKNILIVKNKKAVARIRTYDDPSTGKVNIFVDVTDKKLYEKIIDILKQAPSNQFKLED